MGVIFVWLATVAVSLWEFHGQSMALLAKPGITGHAAAPAGTAHRAAPAFG